MENNEQNVNMAKKGAGFLIIIVALLIALLGLGGYLIYDKFIAPEEDNKKTEEKEKKEEKKEEKEVALNDNAIETQLKTSINILEKLEFLGDDVNHYSRKGDIYYKNIKNEEIKDGVKLYAVLNSVYYDNSNYFVDDHKVEGDSRKSADADKINKLYKSVFGEDAKTNDFGKNNCPVYEYDATTKKYYGNSGCGGTSGFWILTKADRFTKKGDNYYAYVKLAVIEGGEKAYTDYAKTNTYNGTIDKANLWDGEKFFTDENKESFSEYKYTFTKTKDGDYKFVSVEKVK